MSIPVTRGPAADSARDLDSVPGTQRYDGFAAWMFAFHRLVEDNARSVDGLDIDIERNAALGAVLASVRTALARSAEDRAHG